MSGNARNGLEVVPLVIAAYAKWRDGMRDDPRGGFGR
jgi:hypothetical protein